MTRVFLRLVLLAVIGSAAAPARVSAQPAPAPAPVDKKQVARQYTEAGLGAAKLGDYDTAISFYQKAFQLVPHPTLIFNVAEAQRLAGRIDLALGEYKRYLSAAPGGPQAQDAHDRIAELEARKTEEARALEEARKAAKAGDYDAAIGLYQKAYQLVPYAALIFDIAEAQRLAGRIDPALGDYKRYLSEAPSGAQSKDARDRIAELEARKVEEARKAEDDRKAAEAKQAQAEEDRARAAAAASWPSSAPSAAPQDTGAPEIAAPGRNLRIAGISIGAGGIVGAAIGIGFAVHSSTLNRRAMGETTFDKATDDAGHTANAIGYVGTIGGAVMVAAGAVMYWSGYTQGRSAERVTIAPVVSDRLTGVALAGTWR